jgi:HSP20 family protein
MTMFDQIREGLGHARESMAEGWHELRSHTAHALTRFSPRRDRSLQTAEEQVALDSPRWGLITSDVMEEDKQVVVRLEAPGMEKDDFDISVRDGRTLIVRGDKRVEREESRGRYHRVESAFGYFERAVPLPTEVSETGARARYKRGVLRITLPKVRGSESRRIEVKSH